jgi:hypothetical protein
MIYLFLFVLFFIVGCFLYFKIDDFLLGVRQRGCKAIETMVLQRAQQHGYDVEKIFIDLLQ